MQVLNCSFFLLSQIQIIFLRPNLFILSFYLEPGEHKPKVMFYLKQVRV